MVSLFGGDGIFLCTRFRPPLWESRGKDSEKGRLFCWRVCLDWLRRPGICEPFSLGRIRQVVFVLVCLAALESSPLTLHTHEGLTLTTVWPLVYLRWLFVTCRGPWSRTRERVYVSEKGGNYLAGKSRLGSVYKYGYQLIKKKIQNCQFFISIIWGIFPPTQKKENHSNLH
jgi:hypothetical protein